MKEQEVSSQTISNQMQEKSKQTITAKKNKKMARLKPKL